VPLHQALIAGVEEIQGMGDASLIATYSVYEHTKDSTVLSYSKLGWIKVTHRKV
jgi:hypothetical protein